MNMRIWAACLGSAMGGVTLALLLVHGYPSADPLDRFYGALFLALFGGIALLTYSLLAPDWRRTLLRAWLWWPLPLALLEAWR